MDLTTKLTEHLDKLVAKKYNKSLLQVMIYSDKHNISIKKSNINPDQPFHGASIGKMFTATLIGILTDKKKLDINDDISKHLSEEVLDNLFIHNGHDYRASVTIKHLLGHTSGIADYFDSDVNAGSKFVDIVMDSSNKKWDRMELLDFTRQNQKPFCPPGEFHYSDTGYILLGLIVEKCTGQDFATALEKMIFQPLGMTESYLMFYREPRQEIAPVWFNGTEVSKGNLLSIDWAGGGIVSTLEDLLKFQKAYWRGELVSHSYMDQMANMTSRFRAGMHYGLGMMELRFEEFFFLLQGLPRLKGHSGILSTFMFYDTENDVHYVLNMGSNKNMPTGVRLIIKLVSIVQKFKT